MDVGPYYLGSFSQVSHLMENTHHRVKKKKSAGEKSQGKNPSARPLTLVRGRSHRSPPALSTTTHSKAALHRCTAVRIHLLVGFLTEPSSWDVLRELTSHVTFLRKLLQNMLH